jgi:glycine oxidase
MASMKEVIVVGGGVIGLFCAIRLRRGGARVRMLESGPEHVSYYSAMASASAAGMLAPVSSEPHPHERAALESFELWKALRVGAEWADGVRFDGGAIVLADADAASAYAGRAVQIGCKAHAIGAGEFRKRTNLHARIDHGVYVEDEGAVDPLRTLSGLAMQAHALGVLRDYDAEAAEVTPGRVMLHNNRVHEADVVVLAPGAWASDKLIGAAPALGKVRAGKGCLTAVTLERPLGANVRAPGFYLVQRRDEAVLGSTMELDRYDRKVDRERLSELAAMAEQVFPGEVRIAEKAWAGVRPMSPDGWPMIGPAGDGVIVAAGHSCDGWLMAPLTAEIVAAYVFGTDVPAHWAALSPQRFGNA